MALLGRTIGSRLPAWSYARQEQSVERLLMRAIELQRRSTSRDRVRTRRTSDWRVGAVNIRGGVQRPGEADYPGTALEADGDDRSLSTRAHDRLGQVFARLAGGVDAQSFLSAECTAPDPDVVDQRIGDAGAPAVGVGASAILANINRVVQRVGVDAASRLIGPGADQGAIHVHAHQGTAGIAPDDIVPCSVPDQRGDRRTQIVLRSTGAGRIDPEVAIALSEDAPTLIAAGVPVLVGDERRIIHLLGVVGPERD